MIIVEKGKLFNSNDQTYRVQRLSSDYRNVIGKNLQTNEISEIPLSKIEMCYNDQEDDLDFYSLPFESFSEDQKKQAEERYNIIKDILDSPCDPEELKRISKLHKTAVSTIYKWRSRFLKTRYIPSLIDREGRGGKGKSRLSCDVDEILNECIILYYLKKKSITKTYKEIKIYCEKEKISVPSLNTLKNRIRQLPAEQITTGRRGSKKAKELHGQKTGSMPGAEYPYSKVQIDHTRLDIILVDEVYRLPLGRPWYSVLIDICTRVPLGFYISLDTPGNYGTGQAITNALYPKDNLLAEYNLDSEWPVWGPIKTLSCDNAGEFHSEMMENACLLYGITIEFRPAATPHYGGHIERLMGTFNKEIHDLPGTTFSNTKERKYYDYDSEKLAAFTLKEIEEYLVIFITKIYMQRFHKGIGMSPISKLKQFLVGSKDIPAIGIQPLYPDKERTRMDFLPFVERTIQPYGVEIENFKYYQDVVRPFINVKVDTEFTKSRAKKKFIFKVDPNDLSRVFFLHPDSKDYHVIPLSDTSGAAMSKWEKREVEKKLKLEGKPINETEIMSGYNRLKQLEEGAKAKTKKARRRTHRKTMTAINPISPERNKTEEKEETRPEDIDYSKFKSFEVDHESFT